MKPLYMATAEQPAEYPEATAYAINAVQDRIEEMAFDEIRRNATEFSEWIVNACDGDEVAARMSFVLMPCRDADGYFAHIEACDRMRRDYIDYRMEQLQQDGTYDDMLNDAEEECEL